MWLELCLQLLRKQRTFIAAQEFIQYKLAAGSHKGICRAVSLRHFVCLHIPLRPSRLPAQDNGNLWRRGPVRITFSPLCLHLWGVLRVKDRAGWDATVCLKRRQSRLELCVFGGQVATSGRPSSPLAELWPPVCIQTVSGLLGSRWSARKRGKDGDFYRNNFAHEAGRRCECLAADVD